MVWEERLKGFVAIILTFVFCFGFVYFAEIDTINTNKLITECEAPLPRDQHCKIIAVKETK